MPRVGPYEIVLSVAGTSRRAHLARRLEGDAAREFVLIPLTLSRDDAILLEDELARCRKVNHQAIATVVEMFEQDGAQVLVFDRFAGTNLRRLWHYAEETGNALSDAACLHIGFVLFDALAAAHEATDVEGSRRPIVHGHLGPHQVLISSGGAVTVFGFGLSRPYELGRSQRGPSDLLPFVAPENRAGAAPTAAANVYSAAATVWALLAGRPPPGDERPVSIGKLRPDLSQEVAAALDRALQPVAALRSITSRELAIAFAPASDFQGPRDLAVAMTACSDAVDVDGGFIPPESLPPRLDLDRGSGAGEGAAEQRGSTWTTSTEPELSPAERQAVVSAQRRSGRGRWPTPPLRSTPVGSHAPVRSAARRRGVTMPGSRRSPLADMGSSGPRSRSAKRPPATPTPSSSVAAEVATTPRGLAPVAALDGSAARREPAVDEPAEPPAAEPWLDSEPPAASDEPAVGDSGAVARDEDAQRRSREADHDDRAEQPPSDAAPERVGKSAGPQPTPAEAARWRYPRSEAVAADQPERAVAGAARLPVKWLVAAVLIALVSFVTGLVISIGPVSVQFGQEPQRGSDKADPDGPRQPSAPPPPRASTAPSATASSATTAPAVATTSPASASPPVVAASSPADAGDGSALPPDQGYLIVHSSARTLHVYANGLRAGPTNTRVAVECGMKHVRLGDRPLETWHSKGRAVAVDCQSVTEVVIEPDTPVPVGGPGAR